MSTQQPSQTSHCKRGHAVIGNNRYESNGTRHRIACRKCMTLRQMKWNKKFNKTTGGKVVYKRRQNEWKRKRKQSLANLLGGRCIDCGWSIHPSGLEFDHVRGQKLFSVGANGISHTWEECLTEVAKCELRCANCHAIRTHDPKFHAQDPFAELYCA